VAALTTAFAVDPAKRGLMAHRPNVRTNAARLIASGVRMNGDHMDYGQTRICPTQKQPGP
jgi:hypothetical protein